MKRVVFLMVVIFLIPYLSIYIYAVGGGGNGGGSSGGGSGGSSGGSIPDFSSVTCDDSGTISFQMSSMDDSIIAVSNKNGEIINITGYWDLAKKFKSDKKLFVKAEDYSITNSRNIKRTFSCPGLNHCFNIEIKDISCQKTESKIISEFALINETNISKLKYNFKINKRILSYSSKTKSEELRDLVISKEDNMFVLTLGEDPGITDFEVVHDGCLGKNYVYSRAKCVIKGSEMQKPINPDKLKCGGLLDIKDRVKCRINLETEQDEYENFFPEECRNHKDPEKCVKIYRNVSDCWDITRSDNRIQCLKDKINFKNIKSEKLNCGNQECRKYLNEKILTLVKLRFYNLEEQAEILEEHGVLDEEDIIEFIIEIEQKKLEFNEAKTKQEMVNVVKEVRNLWKNLMEKRK